LDYLKEGIQERLILRTYTGQSSNFAYWFIGENEFTSLCDDKGSIDVCGSFKLISFKLINKNYLDLYSPKLNGRFCKK